MGLFSKHLSNYKVMERYRGRLNDFYVFGETERYRLYLDKCLNQYIMRQDKQNPKHVVSLGWLRGEKCVFHDTIFYINKWSYTGDSKNPLNYIDVETGKSGSISVLSNKGCWIAMHIHCQDVVDSFTVKEDRIVIEVTRYKEDGHSEKEFSYIIYITYENGKFEINREFPNDTHVQKSELSIAIENLATNPSVENQKQIAMVLTSYVEKNSWVPIPVHQDTNGYQFKIVENRGKRYAAMYSDNTHIKKDPEYDIADTDINKLIEPVFHNEHIDGIVINPYTDFLCLDKSFLIKCLLHAKYPQQNNIGCEPKNWGAGIPVYDDNDLMTIGEIQNFALHTVLENDTVVAKNFTFVSACDYPSAMPSIILQSENKFAFIYVKGYTALTEPCFTEQEKSTLISLGKKYNADIYFATVGFLSIDPARSREELALKGDGFYCNMKVYENLSDSLLFYYTTQE